MKKLLSALLLLVMLVAALASCGPKEPGTTTPEPTTPPVTTTTPPETTTDVWESIATDVKAMGEANRTFKFEFSDLVEGAYQARAQEYMQGPDAINGSSATIDTLVYERNTAAKNLLGVNISYVYGAYAWSKAMPQIQAQTNDANNPDAADMFAYMMYDMEGATFNASFRDLASIEGSYFDWEKDGWNYQVMEEMSIDRTKIYVMASDYFVDFHRNYVVLPFNMTMLDSLADVLGEVILPAGTTLRDNELLSDYLFQMVQDKKWTYDVLTALCEAIYVDNDTDNEDDSSDRSGIWLDTYGGTMAAAMLYSTDIVSLYDTTATEGDIAGMIRPTYPATGDELNKIFLAVGKLINAKGSYSFGSNSKNANATFATGQILTPGPACIAEIESEAVQAMTDAVSVLPMPLLAEGGTYKTYVHNVAAMGAFNINSTKYIAMSAYIQYCSENSAAIVDEYLQVIMKFKQTTFNLGTSDMLDIVYSNIGSVREMILDNMLRLRKGSTTLAGIGDTRWHANIKGGNFSMAANASTGAFLDKYDTLKAAKQQAMDELVLEWSKLPTAPVAATPAE